MQVENSLLARDTEAEPCPAAHEAGNGFMPPSPLADGFPASK